MASVFLSYDRDDAATAKSIAHALEKTGHSVWWDRHIKSGAQYGRAIDEALKRSEAVVVLWSERSVDSAWVRDEAASGRDAGKLVPVLIDKVDPPLGFRQYQTTDLSRWKGRVKAPEFREMVEAVDALASGEAGTAQAPAVSTKPAPRRLTRPMLIAVAAVALTAILAIALFLWRPWITKSSAPVVAVAAAGQSPSARSLARDLLARLGSLQSTQTDALELVGGGEADQKSDFTFEVDATADDQLATANLVLLGGKDRTLLWSKDFEQPLAKQGDLKQQLAYTAAKVLECAVEALASEGVRIRQQTLKLYLNGCSTYSELAAADPRPLVPVFREVVKQAPTFEGAWAKLLHAEAGVTVSGDWAEDAEKMRPHLLRHMAEARKLNPDMAELLLAEADLAPPGAFGRRMQLLERAVDRNPESSAAMVAYSSYLAKVGRTYDSIGRARTAARLDPLSPFAQDALITALTYAGRKDEALEELHRAEMLSPGASNLLSARYRLHLRYGDPHEALRIQRMGDYGGPHRDAFLKARIDPSPANIEKAISYPRRWLQTNPSAIGELAQVLGAFGKEEELYRILLNWKHAGEVSEVVDVLFRPALRNFHRDLRMIAVAQLLGLLDYWRQSGNWPDFCLEPDLPYDCEAEAAKLATRPN